MSEFYVWIEQDEDGMYVGQVPQMKACYAQGRTLDELLHNIRKVIALCLESQTEAKFVPTFVGVQKVAMLELL